MPILKVRIYNRPGDQKPSEIVDFRGLFLFFVYCGAEGEKRIFNVCQIENITEICYNIKKEV